MKSVLNPKLYHINIALSNDENLDNIQIINKWVMEQGYLNVFDNCLYFTQLNINWELAEDFKIEDNFIPVFMGYFSSFDIDELKLFMISLNWKYPEKIILFFDKGLIDKTLREVKKTCKIFSLTENSLDMTLSEFHSLYGNKNKGLIN